MGGSGSSLEQLIASTVGEFLGSPENRLGERMAEPAWGRAKLGFSCGADPLYDFFKKDTDGLIQTPVDFYHQAFPGDRIEAEDLAVIAWVLPQTEATKRDQRLERRYPSERWALSRTFGEEVNDRLRFRVVNRLERVGVPSVAPILSPLFRIGRSKRYGHTSSWSERHAAYAAGLGTFGLSEGLITELGKAVRLGSVIVRAEIDPSERPYQNHHAYCLFHSSGICGTCIERCPAGAITKMGHDKDLCAKYGRICREHILRQYGFKGTGCGLCQASVPCESRIPEAP